MTVNLARLDTLENRAWCKGRSITAVAGEYGFIQFSNDVSGVVLQLDQIVVTAGTAVEIIAQIGTKNADAGNAQPFALKNGGGTTSNNYSQATSDASSSLLSGSTVLRFKVPTNTPFPFTFVSPLILNNGDHFFLRTDDVNVELVVTAQGLIFGE